MGPLFCWCEREEKIPMENSSKLTEEQQKALSILVQQAARLERRAIIDGLRKHEGKSISVDSLISALEKKG